ncbi:MAG: deoxyribodipyrimidine photo-lyase [Verrucomicrobiales bacterium]|nr:deoxyribodipyrimidine photo-lyase [Verrucomicrobiales bacterium]
MATTSRPSLVWFRNDLRLADQPALDLAIRAGGPVIPVFIWAPDEEAPWSRGGASRWWLHHSLVALDARLRELGSRLIVRLGPTRETLHDLVRETKARAVYWSRRYEPALIARDVQIKESLKAAGVEAESCNAALLKEPWTVLNQSRKPFQVFTPFWKHCLAALDPGVPLPAPSNLTSPERWPRSYPLEECRLLPRIPWDAGLRSEWSPGESGAHQRLARFVEAAAQDYAQTRNRPDLAGTSRLSPHLHFGEIGPRQVWDALRSAPQPSGAGVDDWKKSQFVAEIGWREFAYHLLFHFPTTPETPLRRDFERFPWRTDPAALRAWQRGLTGYPLIDAGMRELWATGWMHNRVRMVAGSFLVKDLLLSWREGAAWFWDTLVDADLASNTLGWQWVAGCGADAAPYFRVFNPVGQGEKFDPEGRYIRRWIPELGRLPNEYLHAPFDAPRQVLAAARIELGKTYPEPIVRHTAARIAALEAFSKIRPADGPPVSPA